MQNPVYRTVRFMPSNNIVGADAHIRPRVDEGIDPYNSYRYAVQQIGI